MARTEVRPATAAPRHLADVTMFWGPASGGVRRYIESKRRWLQSNTGWRHSTVVPGRASGGSAGVHGLPSWPLPFAPGYRIARSRRDSAAHLVALAPDVIEAGDPYNLAWAVLDAARELHVPAVAFAHSDLAALARRLSGAAGEALAQRYLRRLYARFDLVLAPGRALAQRLRALVPGVPVREQPLGVDTRCFAPERADPRWRAALNLPRGTRLLLYAGRFAPEKNLPLLTEALRLLGPAYALVALGDGPAPPAAAGSERLIVLPFAHDQREVARAMASCDAFVHAGDIETFGLVALEAMACATPVVACDAGGLSQLVDDEVGCLVPGGSAARFAEAIAAVCSRDRDRLAASARRRSLAYDWDRVLPQLMHQYTQLIEQAQRGTAGGGRRRADDPLTVQG